MKTAKTAILFDLDGTLWDAADTIAPAWNDWCAAHAVDMRFTPDLCRSYCGKTLEAIAAVVFPDRDKKWREWVISGCCRAECAPLARSGGLLYPCELQVLEELHRSYFLAVVSNCQDGYIESFFTGNGTGSYFDDHESAGRTGLGKAENIRLVLRRSGVRRAVYIGDTEGDEQAARQAGIPFVHAAYGYGTAKAPDAAAGSFSEIPGLVKEMMK